MAVCTTTSLELMTIDLPQTDLAPHVGASLAVMKRDAAVVREGGPTIFASVRNNDGVTEIKEAILSAWGVSGAKGKGKGKGKGKVVGI
jgi:urease accessory protein